MCVRFCIRKAVAVAAATATAATGMCGVVQANSWSLAAAGIGVEGLSALDLAKAANEIFFEIYLTQSLVRGSRQLDSPIDPHIATLHIP